jgi:hypothetical protein
MGRNWAIGDNLPNKALNCLCNQGAKIIRWLWAKGEQRLFQPVCCPVIL